MCDLPVLRTVCRESYNDPLAVYEKLAPDLFLSEEVTCPMPSGTELNLGAYDITEGDHIQLQRRRDDLASLLARLGERRILSVGCAYTNVPNAQNKQEFLDALRRDRGQVLGQHGSYCKLTRCFFSSGASMVRENPATVLYAPLALAVPLGLWGNYVAENVFARTWTARYLSSGR